MESIVQLTCENSVEATGIHWAFNNSMNALEDILGLTAALVAARPNSSTIAINGSTFVTPTRVGSGEKFELVFIIACYCVHRHLVSHFDHSLPENKLLYHRFERAG
jgi:hypothetical protein